MDKFSINELKKDPSQAAETLKNNISQDDSKNFGGTAGDKTTSKADNNGNPDKIAEQAKDLYNKYSKDEWFAWR